MNFVYNFIPSSGWTLIIFMQKSGLLTVEIGSPVAL